MRIAIGEFAHETNTFVPGFTELDDFRQTLWYEGEEVITNSRGVRNDLGGMIDAASRLGIELVPTLATTTQPSATISAHAYETIRDTLFRHIRNAGSLDAICLALHGAGSAEGIEDLEGTLLGELRALVGREIPILTSLDLHGNTTEAMLRHATGLFYCHEYPHIDTYDRGAEIIEMAQRIVNEGLVLTRRLVTLPIIIPGSTTFSGPAKVITDRCYALEQRSGVIDCSFTHGFPHTDVSIISTSVLVTTENDPDLAKAVADEVIGLLYETIEDFHQALPFPKEAVVEALGAEARPVILAEVSDNPGGGAPGNGTHLLRELLAANEPETAFGFIWDPEVAAEAHAAGPGSTIQITLGGFSDDLHGDPIEATAYVKSVTDGRFRLTNPMGAGRPYDLGKMARLVIGNVDVIVGSRRSQTLDPELFLLHGIDVTRYRVVALKSMQHFRGGFQPIAGTILRTDPPGYTTSNLNNMPYTRIKRPIWPLDPLPADGQAVYEA